MSTESLTMLASRTVFYWRDDHHYRVVPAAHHEAEVSGEPVSAPEWTRWTGDGTRANGAAETWTAAAPTWWLKWGELPSLDTSVQVRLEDTSEPEVLRFGNLWICEWVGYPQTGSLTVGNTVFGQTFVRPAYL